MTFDQIILSAIIAATIALFALGRWRHDVIAMSALLACVLTGIVPTGDAFAGFAHPAVITVACVLILSRALLVTGAVEQIARRLRLKDLPQFAVIAALSGLAAVLSAFMNNVGALALLMPVAVQAARMHSLQPGKLLMPLAFASILGGMTTLVGTPPNLIVAGFRAQVTGESFSMFDFSPVGVPIVLAGVAFIVLIGWRLVPTRKGAAAESFETGKYLAEARVPEGSKAIDMTPRQVQKSLDELGAQLVGLVRRGIRFPGLVGAGPVRVDDVLVVEADPESLSPALSGLGLSVENDKKPKDANEEAKDKPENEEQNDKADRDDLVLLEVAVLPGSDLIGRSASTVRLQSRFGINLLALSRRGRRSTSRLRTTSFAAGDVLLLQGQEDALAEFTSAFGGAPLADRDVYLPTRGSALKAALVMLLAVGSAAFGLLPAALGFATGVLLLLLLRVVPPGQIYGAVEWPVIVLLAALLPIADALARTGMADLMAGFLVDNVAQGQAIGAIVAIMILTMTLSDWMNNAATAAVMCPVAISTAAGFGASADPFLMAAAVGASCAFLTPIGHQNNTLILGPGGFRFGDYWRLGLPLQVIVIAVGVPLILWAWPL